jgi:hypothetical protein
MTSDVERALTHFEKLKLMLLKNIEETFERDGNEDASGQLRPQIKPDETSGKTMHDSEGWKTLETSMRNLQALLESVGTHIY